MLFETANAKINWALRVTGRREDGYHLLDMLMQPVSLCDELRAEEAYEISLTIEGEPIAPGPENLIWRAAVALQAFTGCKKGARIVLTKRIPSQAGLGGGSADCAAALRLLRRLWELPVTDVQLHEIGLKLGADVPFCLTNRFSRVRGIGEDVQPLAWAKQIPLVILKPDKGVPTPQAFRILDENSQQKRQLDLDNALNALSNGDWEVFAACAGNDLLAPALQIVPEIGECIALLKRHGALYADMSGSGSAVFGVFPDMESAQNAAAAIGPGAYAAHTIA